MADDRAAKAAVQARYDGWAAAELSGVRPFEPMNAAKRYFRARKLAAALRAGRFPDGRFDGGLSLSTLRYVADLPKALREIHRVLRPGRTAVLDFPNRWCPWLYLKSWLGSERHPRDHWSSASTVRRLIGAAGFRDIRIRHLLFTPTVIPDRLIPLCVGLDWVGERTPVLRRFAGIIMAAATKP